MSIISFIKNFFKKKKLTSSQRQIIKQVYKERTCQYCSFLQMYYVNCWCRNRQAIEERRTSIPGQWNCRYWKPNKKHILERIKELK